MLHLGHSARPTWGGAPSLLSFMSHSASFTTARDPLPDHEQKQAALSYLNEAWAEARHDGVDGDCLAQASLFAALAELTTAWMATAWRRPACSQRLPNWSEPTAKTPWRNSPKACPTASAPVNSRSRWPSSRGLVKANS